ncbi:TonB-dependent receptor domain-containing protein [Flavobacterium sp.]|uniref:TonB-dependent receptor n=1 Tax=Flavobacterium sp. TaxID=239 RepID=UPI0037525682
MKSFLIALFLGFSILANAQNKVVGSISDKQNKPISGATISIPELHKEVISDEKGTYVFNNLPSGNFKIVVSFIGFETQSKTFSSNQKEIKIDVVLEETVHQMDEVIISTAFNKVQSQNVMKVEHQSMKSLQQKGTSTLIEGLATIPGVSQVSTGTSIGKPVIRGLSGNRVLVYSQGVRLENQQFGEEHGLGLNDAGIESVEVIKGPASLLYGSDAIGGVLYFNPEKFAAPNTIHGNFSQKLFSNTNGSNSSIGVKASSENLKFLARGSYNTHADYKIPNGNRVTNTRYNETDFKTALGYSNSKFTSTLRYNFNKLDLGIPENGIAEQTSTKKTTFPKQAVFATILSLNNTVFFKNSKLDADLGYISNDRSEFEDSDLANLHMKLKTYNYNVKYYLPKFGKFESIIGTQGMHQTNVNSGEEYLIPDATTNDFGVFGTINYEWNKNVLQAGVRFDNRNVTSIEHGILGDEGYFQAIDKKFQSFNSSLGFKTNLKENIIFRLNLASGFRAPNLAELTSNGVHEGSNRYEIGNSNLKNEQNFQTDLNLEYRNPHFEIFVNGFYNHINNYIFIAPNGVITNEFDTYDYTQANANLYGGEAGIHFHPHPLDWLHITSSFESVTGKKQNGDNLPLIPANKWNNALKTEFKSTKFVKDGFAVLNVEYTLDQNNPNQFETKSNDYTLINLGFGGKITFGKTAFDVNLNANNLFDKTYISHLSRLKTDGIPNIGRNIVLGINFTI